MATGSVAAPARRKRKSARVSPCAGTTVEPIMAASGGPADVPSMDAGGVRLPRGGDEGSVRPDGDSAESPIGGSFTARPIGAASLPDRPTTVLDGRLGSGSGVIATYRIGSSRRAGK